MSRFHGPQGKGALAELRKRRREEAVERNLRTPPEQRSTKRSKARTS